MERSGNPVLQGDVFTSERSYDPSNAMTIQGTVNKSFVLLLLTVLTAVWTWANKDVGLLLTLPAAIVGFIVALVATFKKEWSPVISPLYALLEGVVLGGVSFFFESNWSGIVTQAVVLTFGTLFCLLGAYKSGWIKPTERFKLGVVAATGGIALFYFVDIVMGFFGARIPIIYSSSPLGIALSISIVIIAALNLILDFDFIESGADSGAPKYMEWYGAFGLMVSLIWLYLEILNLLAKLIIRRRK
jgi:uncharacterized YccA/Bax inhibitor family protein